MQKRIILYGFILACACLVLTGCQDPMFNSPLEVTDISSQTVKVDDQVTVIIHELDPYKMDEIEAAAPNVWGKIKESEETKHMTQESQYSALLFNQVYDIGMGPHYDTSDWVLILTSKSDQEVKQFLFRFDYNTFELKKAHTFTAPAKKEKSAKKCAAIADQEISKVEPDIETDTVYQTDNNCICQTSGGSDRIQTVVVNKYSGDVIFHATELWMGSGKLITPL